MDGTILSAINFVHTDIAWIHLVVGINPKSDFPNTTVTRVNLEESLQHFYGGYNCLVCSFQVDNFATFDSGHNGLNGNPCNHLMNSHLILSKEGGSAGVKK